MSFSEYFKTLDINGILKSSSDTKEEEIKRILGKNKWMVSDLPKLISIKAIPYLETMAQIAQKITRLRFGHTMRLYIPLYLSNECDNECTYCGFNKSSTYKRVTLSYEEILKEAMILKERGFRHILLLTGDAPNKVGTDYIEKAVKILSPHFSSIGLEIQPLAAEEYKKLIQAGADSLCIYQETYSQDDYLKYHPKGKKRNYEYRLDTPDRAGFAGFYRLNLGALLGLNDWRYEALALAYHVEYMNKNFWQTKMAISIPRIQKENIDFQIPNPVSDTELVQMICAFRMVFPDLGISLSTREPKELRDNLLKIGVTDLSAESLTGPGSYSGKDAHEQFKVADERTLAEIQELLIKKGYDPMLKDWDKAFIKQSD